MYLGYRHSMCLQKDHTLWGAEETTAVSSLSAMTIRKEFVKIMTRPICAVGLDYS